MDITSAAGGNLGGGNLGGNLGGKSGNGRPTSNLETASAVALGRKSYNNLRTTHYGLIDWPSPKAVLATSNGKSESFFLKLSLNVSLALTKDVHIMENYKKKQKWKFF